MKHPALLSLVIALAAAGSGPAAIIVPGANGTDGTLDITANTVIDLSQAPTGIWDQDNTAKAGKGVYDPQKWAVVFKYTSVNVATGATVTFKNHPSRAPVVWLVSGDVTIAGTVSLDGQNYQPAPQLAEPGPGGFRGSAQRFVSGVNIGAGFGIGGGLLNGGGGSYATAGSGASAQVYGNPSLIPLIGGSGGSSQTGGGIYYGPANGGAGGGAMLIACQNTISITGTIRANGGSGDAPQHNSTGGAGSGGGLRIVSSSLYGSGSMQATGGATGQAGGLGRIRVERVANNNAITITPAPSVVDLPDNDTAILWPPSDSPEVKIVSIGGEVSPTDPRAAFGTFGADVALPQSSSITVIVETVNVESQSTVRVRITPRDTHNAQIITATRIDPPVSESPLTYHWSATVPTNLGYSAIQAHVVRP